MGVMLSVLVTCVGVVELITFCQKITRHLREPPRRGDLTTISDRYVQELGGIRKRIAEDLQRYQNTPQPIISFNHHEDIEIEYSQDLQNSRSPSPRRFLVTEKDEKNVGSNRKFIVSEEPDGGLKKSKSHTSIPEFLIQQERNYDKSLHKPRYVLKEKPNEVSSSSPIPRQFIVSEESLNTVVFEDVDFEVPENRDEFLNVEKEPHIPRNSICKELEANLREEEPLKYIPSQCSEKVDVILEKTHHNTTEYWTNKILVAPSKISKSVSDDVKDSIKYDEKYLNDLDGVSKAKTINKYGTNRKSFKKKITDQKRSTETKNTLDTTSVLKHAAEELEKVSGGEEPSSSKPGEPFWLIFSGEYTKAMNKDWHGQHFCCWQCDESLTGQRYVLRDDHPYCVSCYENVFANACEKCSRIIGIDSKDLSYKDKHWHEACFLCTTCGESLVDKQFGSKGDRIYCGNCYDQQFASRCDGCHEIFRAGTKKMEYKTRQWHEKCFCCCVCKVPIGTQSFIPREQEIYCAKCYEEKFATRCIKCNKVITSGGVTYKNEPWHRECFTCTHCQRSLAGERFTSRDDKPYCAECFGELFAKRCTACSKPITGIGGTKFISFEDRHWHNDCFFCASCRTSLVGRGFITDQEDIICPDCAKAKLM
ncbi:zinc finger and SCAN domain-containing protein 12 isoform X1 [Diorhabda carinulata]|uniref:zinc finger and SCAN domain-containing protein 12 isoform X1 n=1 Tax=Diorhabda carinulata TaxID=1163345 RepID=UPI0025A2431F|nr:zinc finger and SCAN domain-containing protein 12 isoform X1 [Diorhabda carinulata]